MTEPHWTEVLQQENRKLLRENQQLREEIYLLGQADKVTGELERICGMAIDLLHKLEGVRNE